MAGIPEQRCEANADAEAQGSAPAALDADEARFMRRAIELAWRGWGWTNPNPLVGCVLVRDGRIIGEGWRTPSATRLPTARAERPMAQRMRSTSTPMPRRPPTRPAAMRAERPPT